MIAAEKTVRLTVPAAVARVVKPGAPREVQLQAARGEIFKGVDRLVAMLVLVQGPDPQIRSLVLTSLKNMPIQELLPALRQRELHYQILDFIARVRGQDAQIISVLLDHPSVAEKTLLFLTGQGHADILRLLLEKVPAVRSKAVFREALAANPHSAEVVPGQQQEEEIDEDENKSKYQMALEMKVAEKIEMALKGDKEWRGLLIKDANKMVSSAVLKNPRVTEGEVLALAKNKAATDDQIRLITLNKEWVKNYQIKFALVLHPRTPLPKALRYMGVLTEKDLKGLAKSRGVSQVIVNQARRMLLQKQSKR